MVVNIVCFQSFLIMHKPAIKPQCGVCNTLDSTLMTGEIFNDWKMISDFISRLLYRITTLNIKRRKLLSFSKIPTYLLLGIFNLQLCLYNFLNIFFVNSSGFDGTETMNVLVCALCHPHILMRFPRNHYYVILHTSLFHWSPCK